MNRISSGKKDKETKTQKRKKTNKDRVQQRIK